MKTLSAILEAYVALISHELFMSNHNLAGLYHHIKTFPSREEKASLTATSSVCHALEVACAFYPKRTLCLQRSATLVKLLRRRGVDAHMMIGAQKLPFKAHAWVEADGVIVNDRLAVRENFLVLEVC